MNDKERGELAADIAKRVRLTAHQPLTDDIIQMMGEYPWNWSMPMGNGPYNGVLRVYWNPRPARLDFEIHGVNGSRLMAWIVTK